MRFKMADGISLLSGARFNYNAPEESEVTIKDIAGSLGNVCRFSGHLPRFYSVAQHLVNASYIVEEQFAFDTLMHDTAEAFTNDLPTPLKVAFPVFKELEVKIESAMAARFGFNYPYPKEVKLADTQMLLLEKTYVKLDNSEWAYYNSVKYDHLFDRVDLTSWRPSIARNRFLQRYEELTSGKEGRQQRTCAA